MNDRYRLGGLRDDQLLAALSGLVRRENDSLSELLAHLAELDRRELCVALGYSSLFAYCTEAGHGHGHAYGCPNKFRDGP
jgi:hypothetical protein